MATPKPIRLNQGVIRTLKLDTKHVLMTIKCTSSFDQITAESLAIKDSIYNEEGLRRMGPTGWKLGQEYFGWNISFAPHQKPMFGDKAELQIKSVKLILDDIIAQDADGKLKMNFSIITAGYPREAIDFSEIVKRGELAVTMEKPSKDVEKDAKLQASNFGLFALPKEPKEPKASKEPPAKKDVKVEPSEDADTPPDAEAETDSDDKQNGTLASAGTMGVRTRGRRGAKGK